MQSAFAFGRIGCIFQAVSGSTTQRQIKHDIGLRKQVIGPSLARGRRAASPSLDATEVPWPFLGRP